MTRRGLVLIAGSIVLALAAAPAAGCGPIEYVNTVTRRADTAVEAARAANAPKWSPYWWTRATEYLHQARVEAASADFQAANRFGRLAEEAAVKAREEALRRASDPEAARELELMEGGGAAPLPGRRPGLAPIEPADERPGEDSP